MIRYQWTDLPSLLGNALAEIGGSLAWMLFSPGSAYSLAAMACALTIAAGFLLAQRRSRRPVPIRVLLRALFPRWLWRSGSGRADIAFTLFNLFLAAMLLGWAILSAREVSAWTSAALSGLFGPRTPTALPPALCAGAMTIGLYLAYEFAYWLDHYLSHKIPFLWQFHMVHHSAETLSPLTNFRVHPVDSLVFYNLVALFMGSAEAALNFGFGRTATGFAVNGANVLLLAAAILLTRLHHSHLWISFTGGWGRALLSPAHHQIHHSADPAHFDRNFGNSLAVWDWLFGTLNVPTRKRQRLTFGVAGLAYRPHRFGEALVMPLVAAFAPLRIPFRALPAAARRRRA